MEITQQQIKGATQEDFQKQLSEIQTNHNMFAGDKVDIKQIGDSMLQGSSAGSTNAFDGHSMNAGLMKELMVGEAAADRKQMTMARLQSVASGSSSSAGGQTQTSPSGKEQNNTSPAPAQEAPASGGKQPFTGTQASVQASYAERRDQKLHDKLKNTCSSTLVELQKVLDKEALLPKEHRQEIRGEVALADCRAHTMDLLLSGADISLQRYFQKFSSGGGAAAPSGSTEGAGGAGGGSGASAKTIADMKFEQLSKSPPIDEYQQLVTFDNLKTKVKAFFEQKCQADLDKAENDNVEKRKISTLLKDACSQSHVTIVGLLGVNGKAGAAQMQETREALSAVLQTVGTQVWRGSELVDSVDRLELPFQVELTQEQLEKFLREGEGQPAQHVRGVFLPLFKGEKALRLSQRILKSAMTDKLDETLTALLGHSSPLVSVPVQPDEDSTMSRALAWYSFGIKSGNVDAFMERHWMATFRIVIQGERECFYVRAADVLHFMQALGVPRDASPKRLCDFVKCWTPETLKEFASGGPEQPALVPKALVPRVVHYTSKHAGFATYVPAGWITHEMWAGGGGEGKEEVLGLRVGVNAKEKTDISNFMAVVEKVGEKDAMVPAVIEKLPEVPKPATKPVEKPSAVVPAPAGPDAVVPKPATKPEEEPSAVVPAPAAGPQAEAEGAAA